MKLVTLFLVAIIVGNIHTSACVAETPDMQGNHPKIWKENTDGDLKPDEYRKISENGGTTRRPCPYTCEDRGVARKTCKEWKSKDGNFCYVQDLNLPDQHPVPLK